MHDGDQKFTRAGFVRASVVPALLLFAIPLLGYAFATYADRSRDARFLAALDQQLAKAPDLSPTQRAERLAVARQHPLSAVCADEGRGRAAWPRRLAARACREHTQVGWLRRASGASLVLGFASVIVALGCAGVAFVSPGLQYASFVAGWNVLRAASAIQVVTQGVIAVLLAFWLSVLLTGGTSGRLAALVGLLALGGVAMLVRAIFVRIDDMTVVEGEPIPRRQAPALWARIDGLCARLGTAPVDHLVAGIDDNFFVTEHPLHVDGRVLTGRTLFVSLSLLKRLEKGEADAILAHEMAHFSGGDTRYSTRLAPRLARFGAYLEALHGGLLSRPVFHFMLCYWSLLQLALSRTSRERELRADRIAAEQTSPASVANALYKVAAYSAYRRRVEHALFDTDQGHAALDIANRVAEGFAEYARGPHLKADLAGERFPHPFDSHPPMAMRIAAVGVQPRRGAIADALPPAGGSWFDEIGDAARIEAAQWAAYEGRFQAAHGESLAYRYLPSTPEERAHVEQHFPLVEYDDRQGVAACTVDCDRIHYRDWPAPVSWADVVQVQVREVPFRGKVMTLKVEMAGRRPETLKLPVRTLAGKEEEILARLGSYYDRYLSAKAYQSQAA